MSQPVCPKSQVVQSHSWDPLLTPYYSGLDSGTESPVLLVHFAWQPLDKPGMPLLDSLLPPGCLEANTKTRIANLLPATIQQVPSRWGGWKLPDKALLSLKNTVPGPESHTHTHTEFP